MNKNKINQIIILCILIIVIIVVISVIMNLKNKLKVEDILEEPKKEINSISYYNYFNKGIMDKDIITKNIQIPNDYFNYISNIKNMDSIIEKIVEISIIEIPYDIIKTYEEEIYQQLQQDAKSVNMDVDEYIKVQYNIENYEQFIRQNETSYARTIMKDMIYQALALKLNIIINDDDLLEYYSVKQDELKNIFSKYGENLAYKYVLENKVEKELRNK